LQGRFMRKRDLKPGISLPHDKVLFSPARMTSPVRHADLSDARGAANELTAWSRSLAH
jgi:hypothetical protein